MNIFDIKESKIKAFLNYLYKHDATSKGKAVPLDDVESGLRIDDNLFDEVARYVVAEGYASRAAPRKVYLTKAGLNKVK